MVTRHYIKMISLFALSPLLMTGCAQDINVDNQLDMVAVPAAWQSPDLNTIKSDLNWLKQNQWAQLPQIVIKALENNPDLRISANRLRSALAQQQITDGNRSVTGDIRVAASRNGDFQSTITDRNSFSLRGGLAWEADVWGRLANDSRASQQSVYAAKNDLDYAKMSLTIRTAQRWFDVTESILQNKLLEQNLEKILQSQDLVSSRYRRGLVGVLDVLRIETDVATARSNIASQQQTISERTRSLETLIGSYPSGLVPLDAKLPELDDVTKMGLPTTILNNRPDIMAAKNRVLEANYDLKVAKKALYPSLSISTNASASAENLRNIVDIDSLVWSVVGNIIQPVLDGGRRRQQVVINEVSLDTSLANYLKIILNAYLEAENALTAEVTLAQQQQHLLIAVDRALASEEKAMEEYAKGLIDILSLLDVQRRSISAQQSLLRVKHRRLINRATLHLALGGQNIESYINQMAQNNQENS